MNDIAERGIAAHWMYKEGGESAQDAERAAWLRSLVEGHQENPRDFLNSLKLDLYPEDVYTFTPKGEVFAFPRGATPIDFAYRVHTEVGRHCVGARINGRLVPLRTPLQNGDIVEILTSPNQMPSRDWLELAVTAKAKNKIRGWLNRGEKDQAVDAGRRLIERECRRQGIGLKKLREEGQLDRVAGEHGFGKEEDLMAALGFGRVSIRDVLAPFLSARPVKPTTTSPPVKPKVAGDGAPVILVKGQRDMLSYRARCCNPLPGDEIVGYITRGKGVAVHNANCHNVRRLLFAPEREVEVEWGSIDSSAYPVPLHVSFEDRQGMLAAISGVVSGEAAGIRSFHLSTHDGHLGTADFIVDIRGRDHLERLLVTLRRIPGVTTVLSSTGATARRGKLN
jgi:guanosine-3',5'-bis(diphosphate) 3'-pyrophosphohydrolase